MTLFDVWHMPSFAGGAELRARSHAAWDHGA